MGAFKPWIGLLLSFGVILLLPLLLFASKPAWWAMHTAEAWMAHDPIDRLSFRLDASNAYCLSWDSGFWSTVELPASATPEDFVAKYFTQQHDFQFGNGHFFKILETKPLPLSSRYSAALIDNGRDRRIVVFDGGNGHWVARDYAAD